MPHRTVMSSRAPSNDRRELVREDRGKERQIARAVMLRAKPVANGRLTPYVRYLIPGFGVEVEHIHHVAQGRGVDGNIGIPLGCEWVPAKARRSHA